MIDENPFHLKGYHGANLFCDREPEAALLADNAKNGVNTTLISIRRLGKTGLIHHVFQKLNRSGGWYCIYIDIYATQSLQELANQVASAILAALPSRLSIWKKFANFLKGLSTAISYDPFTGAPEISFSYATHKQYEQSLKGMFGFLDSHEKRVLVAFDEFQQIANYPENNIEGYNPTNGKKRT